MSKAAQLIFYTLYSSPHAHRVHLALEHVKAEYTSYTPDLINKPAWFIDRVSPPDGKVPAILYGGPKCSPEEPSSESTIVNESLVCLEFLADIFPNKGILPSDPAGRAAVRGFVLLFEQKLVRAFMDAFYRGETAQKVLDALEVIQARLPPGEGFAYGEWSMAEMYAAPFLVRAFMMLDHEIGKYPEGEGKKVMTTLRGEAKYARVMKYVADIEAHPTFKATWDFDAQLGAWGRWSGVKRGEPVYQFVY